MAEYNIYVGTETGYLKALGFDILIIWNMIVVTNRLHNLIEPGVSASTGLWRNLNSSTKIDNSHVVKCMCWNNCDKSEICIGYANQEVLIYKENEKPEFLSLCKDESDTLISISKFDDNFVTCTEAGKLQIWNNCNGVKLETSVGANVNVMKQKCREEAHIFATGGKENELKIWDLAGQGQPTILFTAKNVKNDWLDLRVPVYICDVEFVPDSNLIFTSTGLHQVRLYDTKCQRRPIAEMLFEDTPITTISIANSNKQIVVGNTRGVMGLLDMRGKGHLVHKFKGANGAIKQVLCSPQQNIVASCGLDRFLRIHDIQSKVLLHKEDKTTADNDIWAKMEVVKTRPQEQTSCKKGKKLEQVNQFKNTRKRKLSE
ncbi:hypothetical protein HELRODRAFT_170170 [Helobdella robusta]|uniref:Uncharacterized protein n=1 Tax=Helobdella robusta TaxID=6412 RepID=T1F2Q8_HELRO|nr:hypothetical protein HELRODRAFT_170170 [Helobdella robusta]ESO07625.1 hypothetical protein HELRODRAFT_170170 [Helobdella robusta]